MIQNSYRKIPRLERLQNTRVFNGIDGRSIFQEGTSPFHLPPTGLKFGLPLISKETSKKERTKRDLAKVNVVLLSLKLLFKCYIDHVL